jgi:hypothetical protein
VQTFRIRASIIFDSISCILYSRGRWELTLKVSPESIDTTGASLGDPCGDVREVRRLSCHLLSLRTQYMDIGCTWVVKGSEGHHGQISLAYSWSKDDNRAAKPRDYMAEGQCGRGRPRH